MTPWGFGTPSMPCRGTCDGARGCVSAAKAKELFVYLGAVKADVRLIMPYVGDAGNEQASRRKHRRPASDIGRDLWRASLTPS